MSQSSSFNRFYQTWFEKLHTLVDQLKTAPQNPSTPADDQILADITARLISHYEEYFRVKKLVADSDVLSLFSCPWSTPLEKSLHWVAGYRPTTVFHLVYTESSIRFESHILDILRGLRTGDLGDLSPSQMNRFSELQCETVREENAITEELSAWQEGSGDLLVKMGGTDTIDVEIRRLVNVVKRADDLRLNTIKKVAELLSPQQAVEFFTAVVELQFGVRGWGLTEETRRGRRSKDNSTVNPRP